MTLQSGTKLGAYEILEPIGAGGQGEVYRAKDTRIDRTVAIKVLPSALASDAGLKQRFAREAKSISSLNHPHICTLYEFDSHDGTDFLVMEHLEGESLAARLARKGALPFDTAVRYAVHIAEALDGAHRHGITHRDLKPGNIMLTEMGPKLLDFGLAKLANPQVGAHGDVSSVVPTQAQPLTEQGAILGTFQYMAPEQLEGKEADARTDIFAFGAVVYEMITGKRAFEGKSQASLIGITFSLCPSTSRAWSSWGPVPVIEASNWQFDVARNGTLLYLPSEGLAGRRLVWVDRNGVVSPAVDEPQGFSRPHLSADGRRVAVEVRRSLSDIDIWVYDLERRTRTRVTTDSGGEGDPVWAPDGESIVFGSNRTGARDLFSRAADGSGEVELLLTSDVNKDPHSFSPDGKRLAFYERRGANRDIWILDVDEKKPEPFVASEFNERSPSFSLDGRFIAYVSDASGQNEIYVQPYPGPGTRTVISTEGGYGPVWSRDGKELFYRNDDRMMAVTVETEPRASRFSASVPEMLFEGAFLSEANPDSGSQTYDVSADGQKFLMVEAGGTGAELHVVLNWLEELEARVPGAR